MKKYKAKALVILTPGFPAHERERAFIPQQQVFVNALKRARPEWQIVIITFFLPAYWGEYRWNGIRVIAFGRTSRGKASSLWAGIGAWRALIKLKREYEIIGLLSFWLGMAALVGQLFARWHGLRHFCWLLGQDARPGNPYVGRIRPKGDRLIALSDFIVREFSKNYGITPRHVIPVGIDPDLFDNGWPVRSIDILGVGSLIPLKQYDVFMEVIYLLKGCRPQIKAVICGDGPELERLKAMRQAMDLEDNVSLVGRLAHGEALKLMQRSRILLHPSNYEGFGAVCLEALYAGAHVVSFVQPMDAEISQWHHVADREGMVAAVTHILDNPATRHASIMPYPITANVKAMLRLFQAEA